MIETPAARAASRATMDGSEAVVWVETRVSQAAFAYPITPSTPMGQGFQHAVANGKTNLWGEPLSFLELESEHSSASSCEGFALAGGRATNFTSGQGLILMKEVLYVIAGKRLPVVFHIGARALTSHALNIHAGHDDVMGVADCGWGMLFARNVQEALDLALIARRAAEETATPYFHVQDGFLTTHTLETVALPSEEAVRDYVGSPAARLANLFDTTRPVMSGVVQNQDAYMKGKVAQRFFYDRMRENLTRAMDAYEVISGRRYGLVESYRLEDARFALVGMGSMMETAKATVDWLREERGVPAGCLHVTSFRPFPGEEIVAALAGVEAAAVLERMDNPAAQGNPLTLEIKAAFADSSRPAPVLHSGVAGLGGRDVRPGDLVATVQHMASGAPGPKLFFLGIPHDDSLPRAADPDVRPKGAFAMRGHSLGGYGSVTTNKVIASLVADIFDLHVQAHGKYGSEKKGLPTTFFLTAAPQPVRAHCEAEYVDFVAVLDWSAFESADPLRGLCEGGIVFFPSPLDPEAAWKSLPESARKTLREKRARVFTLDAARVARAIAPTPDLAVRMQGIVLLGVFLRVTPFRERSGLDEDSLFAAVEQSLAKYFGRRGEAAVRANVEAARRGYTEVREVSL